jgi:prolyl oligopeptidase PreP (S9A serine peptidase family)
MHMPDSLTCERVEARSRDGTMIPMVMVYDSRYYNDQSPWVIFHKGA